MNHNELIEKLNEIHFFTMKDIRVGNVLWLPTWGFKNWSSLQRGYMIEHRLKVKKGGEGLAFFISHVHASRKDHYDIFRKVCSLFPKKTVLVEQEEGRYRLFCRYSSLLPVWYWQLRKLPISRIQKLQMVILLCELKLNAENIMRMLKKQGITRLFVFSDAIAIENLVSQLCNQQHIYTITMQHGIVNGCYDYVEYRASACRKFLVWGEYSKDMAIRYGVSENRIAVVGNIMYTETLGRQQGEKLLLVALSGVDKRADRRNNFQLLQNINRLAKKYDLFYVVRCHPNDKIEQYNIMIDEKRGMIQDNEIPIRVALAETEFVACGNSTVFVDAIFYGIPVVRFINFQTEKKDVCMGIGFGKVQTYEQLEQNYRHRRTASYQKELYKIRNYLICTEDVENRYINAIEGDF